VPVRPMANTWRCFYSFNIFSVFGICHCIVLNYNRGSVCLSISDLLEKQINDKKELTKDANYK
jgi:hypothetical protein